MGASVSICNLTSVIINVALRHATPLYYQNQLMPTKCANFTPGRVWFTVEAKVWINGTNEYTDAQVALPIAAASLVAPVVAGFVSVVAMADQGRRKEPAKPTIPKVNDSWVNPPFPTMPPTDLRNVAVGAAVVGGIAAIPGTAIGIAGTVINTDNKTPKGWRTQKHGVYMTPGKVINIIGGPKSSLGIRIASKAGFKYQYFDKNAEFDPLHIETV